MVTANRTSTTTPTEFVNEAVLNYSDPQNATAQEAALSLAELRTAARAVGPYFGWVSQR